MKGPLFTLLQALSEAIKAETAVRSFNDLMVNKLELELLAKSGVDYILNYLNAESGCVVIERGGEFFIPYSYGIKNVTEILENDNLWKYFENRKIQKLNIDSGLTTDALLLSYDPKEVHLFPLLYKDVPLGLLIIGSSKEISNRLIQTMGLFSQSFAISLNNSITYSQLQKLAANDPLTGLYNRRFGLSRLSDEFSRSVRTPNPVGCLNV